MRVLALLLFQLSNSSDIAPSIAIQLYMITQIDSDVTTNPSGLSSIAMINGSLITSSLIIEFHLAVCLSNNNFRLSHINIGKNSITTDYSPLITPSFIVEFNPSIRDFNYIHNITSVPLKFLVVLANY